MQFKEAEQIVFKGGTVAREKWKGFFLMRHPEPVAEGKLVRLIVVHPKGSPKYPKGTYRLFDGAPKDVDAHDWQEVAATPEQKEIV
jgi:hypothetical protein